MEARVELLPDIAMVRIFNGEQQVDTWEVEGVRVEGSGKYGAKCWLTQDPENRYNAPTA